MTNLEAANARKAEADEHMKNGDFDLAARDYTLAAEQLAKVWQEMHGDRGHSPDEQIMRARAHDATVRHRMAWGIGQ